MYVSHYWKGIRTFKLQKKVKIFITLRFDLENVRNDAPKAQEFFSVSLMDLGKK